MLRKLPNEEPRRRKRTYLTFTEEKGNGRWEKTSRKVYFRQVLVIKADQGKDPHGKQVSLLVVASLPNHGLENLQVLCHPCKSLVLWELKGDSPFLQVSSGTRDFRTTLSSLRKICPFALLHGPFGKTCKVRNVLLGQSNVP